MTAPETIPISKSKLDALIEATKRHIRRSGGPEAPGMGELTQALGAVVRETSEAALRAELDRPLPAPVPAEEEAAS